MREESEIISEVQVIYLFHESPLYSVSVDVFMSQLMASKKRKGDNEHPCLTPVRTLNGFVSWPP
jgi:hypothetical protein